MLTLSHLPDAALGALRLEAVSVMDSAVYVRSIAGVRDLPIAVDRLLAESWFYAAEALEAACRCEQTVRAMWRPDDPAGWFVDGIEAATAAGGGE